MAENDPTTAPQDASEVSSAESVPQSAATAGETESTPEATTDPSTDVSTDAPADVLTDASAEVSADVAAIDDLLKQAAFDDPAAVAESAGAPAPDVESFQLPSFNQAMQEAQVSSIDLLKDVELNVKIELGRSRMLVEDVLKLGEGSVVELDKLAGDPVDVFVNDRLVARGEVLVLNDNFCVRVNEIVAGAKEEGL